MRALILLMLAAAPAAAQTCPRAPDLAAERAALIAQMQRAPTPEAAADAMNRMWLLLTGAPDPKAQDLLDRGMAERQDEDLDSALAAFDQLVQYCPDFPEGYNQRAFVEFLEKEMTRARRLNHPLSLAYVDIDNFKQINDAFGHPVGDEALRHFACALTDAIRPYDHAGRWGGEEFLLVLSDVPLPVAEKRLADIHASISNLHIQVGESQIVLNCTVGGTIFDSVAGPTTNEALLSLADEALYAAKSAGRNCVVFRAPVQTDLTPKA